MGRRALILVSTSVVAVLALLVWRSLSRSAPEPRYQERPLSDWLVQLTDSDSQAERDRAAVAVRAIGTNAIPTLLQMLNSQEPPLWTKFLAWRRGGYHPFGFHFWQPPNNLSRAQAGFDQLGPLAAPAVPDLIKILDDNRSRECSERTATIFGNIGPEAKAAVPSLLRRAVSKNRSEHYFDFAALGKIHAEPALTVPVLIEVISNSPGDRYYAVSAVGQFGSNAKAAVPILVALISDPSTPSTSPRGAGFISDRENTERALQSIDPGTYAQLVSAGKVAPVP